MKFLNQRFLLLIYIFSALIGLWFLTKSWLPAGYTLAGHDSGLALSAKNFLASRFYAWDDRINFGEDNSLNFGSITLHSIDYLLSFLAGVESAGNQIAVFFWISTIFISAFIFSLIMKDYFNKFFVFLFPVFITFNFYIFQSLFMLERAKYGLVSATMLFLALVILVMDRKISIILATLISSIVFFIFNGGSIWGLPLYGGLVLLVIVMVFCVFIWDFQNRDFTNLKRLTTFLALSIIGYFFINSYAIFPYIARLVSSDYVMLFNQEVTSPNRAWLDYISLASSFVNVIRMQGIPDWYSNSFIINPNHPYAQEYSTKLLLIFSSFLFPLLTLSSFFLVKTKRQKKFILFFNLLVLISYIFVAGTHAPLGFIYGFLYDNVPGFSIFRTPFYKFGSVLFLGLAVLISFTLSSLIDRILFWIKSVNYNLFTGFLLSIIFIIAWFGYYKVFLSSNIFYWQKTSTTRVEIPEYIKDFKNWIEKENINSRILLLPSLDEGWKVDSYNWGYWSLSTLPSMLISKNSIANDGSLGANEKAWLLRLYSLIEQGKETDIINIASRLNIEYFLLRKDALIDDKRSFSANESHRAFSSNKSSVSDPLSLIAKTLDTSNQFIKIKSFGEWNIYKINNFSEKKIYASQTFVELPADQLSLYKDFAYNKNIILNDKVSTKIPDKLYSQKVDVHECISCEIETVNIDNRLPIIRILPNSPLYSIKKFREKVLLSNTSNDQGKINTYMGLVFRRAGEVKKMLDFGFKEKYLKEDLRIQNDYLATINQLLKSSAHENDFEQAKTILKLLNPIETNYRIEIDKAKSGTYGAGVISGMTDVLWQIYNTKSYFSGILEDNGRWANEKLYNLHIPNEGFNGLFLLADSLPVDENGEFIYPSQAIITNKDQKITLKLNSAKDSNLLRLDIPAKISGNVKLALNFSKLPNKFKLKNSDIQVLTSGPVACIYGDIDNFVPFRSYKIKIQASNSDQSLKLFIKEDSDKNAKLNFFLHGEKEISINPILNYEPFTYLYQPSHEFDYASVYICNENKEIPNISSIVIDEVFSPEVIISSNNQNLTTFAKMPEINYKRINPTQYEVNVKNATQPFVLVFNERYDPLWEIQEINNANNLFYIFRKNFREDKSEAKTNPFIVDGYANGWIIDKTDNKTFVIEYATQKLFYLGSIVTLISGIIIILGIGYFLIYRR